MPSREEEALISITNRVEWLVSVLLLLAVVLVVYMVAECALLVYSLYKKKKLSNADPEAVVVKGDKKQKTTISAKKPSKSKSKKKKGKSDFKSSKSVKSSKKSKCSKSSKQSKCSKSSVDEGAKSKKGKPKKEEKSAKSKKAKSKSVETGTSAASKKESKSNKSLVKTATSTGFKALDVTSDPSATENHIARLPPQFPPQKKDGPKKNDTATGSLIAKISNQFPVTPEGVNFTTKDTTTQQLIDRIPPQFESPKTAREFECPLNRAQLEVVAKEVAVLISSSSEKVAPNAAIQEPPKTNIEPPINNAQESISPVPVVIQPPSNPTNFAQPVHQQQVPGQFQPIDSVYVMGTDQNGETPKVAPPANDFNTTNLLMVDGSKVVPTDGVQRQ